MPESYDIQNLPKPRPTKGGSVKPLVLALLAVAVLGGVVFWLTRDADEKEALKSNLQEVLDGTPLASVSKLVTPPPPPPPPRVTSPATQPGTLAGQVVQGTVASPVDASGAGAAAPPEGTPEPVVAPKVEEDSMVRPLFVEDLAQWLVARYQPGKDGGTVNLNLSALNMRYGAQLRGITYTGEDALAGRASLLRYAFNAPMLTALYNLYVDRFVDAMGQAAAEPWQGKALTPEQTDDMFKAYAVRFAALGSVLQGIGSMTDFPAKMAGVAKLAQQATNVHSQMAEAVFALDEAREAGNKSGIEVAQLRVNGLNAQYQRLMSERNTAQHTLVNAIRQGGANARGVDDDTILFVATWVERRIVKDAQTAQTVITASRLLDDLGARLRKAGSIAR